MIKALPAINESIKKIIDELERISGILEMTVKENTVPSDDILYPNLKAFVKTRKTISASIIQRRFRVGYARATRLLDMLADDRIIESSDGVKPRKVIDIQ